MDHPTPCMSCELCGRATDVVGGYIVRIDVFADPNMPAIEGDIHSGPDFDQTLANLIAETQNMTADELQDGVHRRFEYRLCAACQKQFLANPMGKPRQVNVGTN